VARTARQALSADGDTPMAVLYRTNAQSRVIEDALRREAITYRIVGSVRFYERREVKDAWPTSSFSSTRTTTSACAG